MAFTEFHKSCINYWTQCPLGGFIALPSITVTMNWHQKVLASTNLQEILSLSLFSREFFVKKNGEDDCFSTKWVESREKKTVKFHVDTRRQLYREWLFWSHDLSEASRWLVCTEKDAVSVQSDLSSFTASVGGVYFLVKRHKLWSTVIISGLILIVSVNVWLKLPTLL